MQLMLDELNSLLQRASFTYARCIHFLPSPLKEAVTLAYLLLRIADTIEDAFLLTKQERINMLGELIEIIKHPYGKQGIEEFVSLFGNGVKIDNPDHFIVLQKLSFITEQLHQLPSKYIPVINEHVIRMAEEMQCWINRHDEHNHLCLQSLHELDCYCFSVAGVPGEMLSNLFSAYSPYISNNRLLHLLTLGNNYAIGVQIANILKSHSQDTKEGRNYIPKEFLPSEPDDASDKITHILVYTYRHLTLGIEYVQNLPVEEVGIRSFCLVPLLLAVTVLNQLLKHPEELFSNDGINVPSEEISSLLEQVNTVAVTNQSIWEYWRELTIGLKATSQRFVA